jgi:two-component system LytT family response regulator
VIERVLIVDDEPLARERLRELVRAAAKDALIEEAGDGDAAIERITQWKPQAVFLDIQMPRRDGFGVVAAIGADRMPPVAFVTAFDAHAMKAFDVSAVDYLLKPFDDARFAKTWQRLSRAHAAASLSAEARKLSELLAAVGGSATSAGAPTDRYLERFLVKVDERTFPVPVQDVRWLESEGNYLVLHTAQGKHTVRESLGSVEERLDPARFVRIHRSVIVALDQIKEMQPWFAGDQVLILKDGTKLRVSRTRRAALTARLAGER